MENNLLLEIGTEEIPAKLLQRGIESLKNKSSEILLNHRISYANITVYGTPRRLILLINNLSDVQDDITSELRGPAKNIAFDPAGKITEAGQRFADKCGVKVNDLVIKDFKNNDYIFAVKKVKGLKTKKIIPDLLLQIIKSLSFPKQMRWEDTNFRFVRPIRWITALLNDKVIKFSLAGINSSRYSFGHRLKGNKPVLISDPRSYKATIEKEMVIIDPQERKNMIKKQLNDICSKFNALIVSDEDLLDHVTNLVEFPHAIAGSFDESYLRLPGSVLITVMKEQQKYFAISGMNQRLLPNFIVVTNSFEKSQQTIRLGNEWVFKARLNDASFFWNEDIKKPLESRIEGLKGIVFQNKLGTIFDKVERIKLLGIYISKNLNLDLSEEDISKLSDICKADLLTEMVKEFPTLQGCMGEEYFSHQGGNQSIAEAIFEHYLPRHVNDILPEKDLGAVLSISDKMDNILSFFLLNKIPTGSEDPFALRRQANGILQIIWHKNYDISLSLIIDKSLSLLKDKLYRENINQEVKSFFLQRFRNLLLEEGIKYDCIDAVLAGGFDNPLLDKKRVKALVDIYAESDFKEIATSFSRVTNILKNVPFSFDIKPELLTENAEKRLYSDFLAVKEHFYEEIRMNAYYPAYGKLKPLRGLIDSFFNDVLVMDKNKEIQQNRLNLLYNIASMFYKIADFSKIVI